MIGSIHEAKLIFDACGDRWIDGILPEGWSHLGGGSTREAYLSPSGVVYKICHYYQEDYPSENEYEFFNFARIKQDGRLPKGWMVPEVTLHDFEATFHVYSYDTLNPEMRTCKVAVLASEYVPGPEESLDDSDVAIVFAKVGLTDCTTLNAKRHQETDRYYIIDAGEWVEHWPTPVAA